MIIADRDLGPTIPVCIPEAGKGPVVHRGWRLTKHFTLFQNPHANDAWTIATGHGQVTYGTRLPIVALRLAEDLEDTGVDWTLYHSYANFGDLTAVVLSIANRYRDYAVSRF